MNRNGAIILVVIVLLIIIGLVGYFSHTAPNPYPMDDQTNEYTPTTDETPTSTDSTTVGADVTASTTVTTPSTKSFTVNGGNFYFAPSTLSVNKGDKVKITFVNTGGTHDLRVDGYNVGTHQISGGQTETFEFTADKAGTFEYYCSVGTHRQMGMKGTLTVK